MFAAFAFGLAVQARKLRLAYILAVAIVVLGLAPLVSSMFLQNKGVYRIRVVVLGPDSQPVSAAEVSTSTGAEIKKANGNWEVDVSPQTRPADGKVTVFASVKDSFLAGDATVTLSDEYYQSLTIRLAPLPDATIRGIVTDSVGRSAAGAKVSVPGYRDVAVTDQNGNFALPAHAPNGKMTRVHAEKGGLVADLSCPAGNGQVELNLHRP